MMAVEEVVPACVARIAVFLAIGYLRRCSSWASRGPRGGLMVIGAGAEGHSARGEVATDGAMLVIGGIRSAAEGWDAIPLACVRPQALLMTGHPAGEAGC